MKRKAIKGLSFILSVVLLSSALSSCTMSEDDPGRLFHTFEELCKTTEDGFVYFVDEKIGLCIIDIPKTEEVIIPEYIDGMRVMQLGYRDEGLGYLKEHWIDGRHVKSLVVQHTFGMSYVPNFNNIEKMTYVDFIYCRLISLDQATIKVGNNIDGSYDITRNVELKKSNRNLDISKFNFSIIEIPKYVTHIDSGVFDGLNDVIIRTSYESKPDGWEDGWNGECVVEWGATIK